MYELLFTRTRYLRNSARVSFSYFPCCRSWPNNVHVLQACFKMMEVARKHGIKSFVSERNLHEVYSYLRLNLCSASHVVRLLTLKMLSCFDQPERSSSDNKVQYRLKTLCMHAFRCCNYLYIQGSCRFLPMGSSPPTEFAPTSTQQSTKYLKFNFLLSRKKTTLCARWNKTIQNMFISRSLIHWMWLANSK